MKKKETIWQLLKRLDEEAGEFNFHLHEANRYFDKAASKTIKALDNQEKKLRKTISKVRKAIKSFVKKRPKK